MSDRATAILLEDFEADTSRPKFLRPAWLEERGRRALADFREGGVPYRRIEEWKYTDLRGVLEARNAAGPSGRKVQGHDPFSALESIDILIEDGRTTLPPPQPGIEFFDMFDENAPHWTNGNLGNVLSAGAMADASLAMMRGGLAIHVSAETTVPVHLRFLQRLDTVHCRLLLVIGQGASLTLLETHGGNPGLINLGVEVVLEPGAQLTHLRLADTGPDAVQVEEVAIRLAHDARYRGHFSQKGARLSRVELAVALEGEGAEAELSGTSVLGGKLHSDVTTHVEHIVGNTASRQLFKHVAGGHARTVYQGKISVHKGADGSDSRQTAKAILLGARAEADLKPELEILADDVKCAHGAAVGDLDADSLFYLRSRGIPQDSARRLLLSGFLKEAVDRIEREDIRAAVWQFVESGLAGSLEMPA
jgi:Fe-S cluster assembly protein SufD